MKIKKYLYGLLLIGCLIISSSVNALEAPDTLSINGNDVVMVEWNTVDGLLPKSTSLRFSTKRTSTGLVAYCTEAEKGMVNSGSRETYIKDSEASDRILYILMNGLHGNFEPGTGDQLTEWRKSYFATGIAVWYALGNNDNTQNFNMSEGTYGSKPDNSNATTKKIASLVNNSVGYKYTSPSFSISDKNATLTLSNDKHSYVTKEFSPAIAGDVKNYTVKLNNAPTGSKILDSTGAEKTTFNNGEKFKVSVPVASVTTMSTNFSISINASATDYVAYNYKPSNSSYQRLVVLFEEPKNFNSTINVTLTLTNKVSISKQDATNGKELPGATLILKDENGNEKLRWISTNEPKIIENLAAGKYYLTELIAPDGYVKSSETVTFTINPQGQLVDGPVIMKNALKDPVYISKQDFTTGREVPGATLVLKDASDKEVAKWVSSNTPHSVGVLSPGNYTLIETIAPFGYEKSSEKVTFTVKEDGTVDRPVIMYNKSREVIVNPQTGMNVFGISIFVAFLAFAISFYYYADYKVKANM